jgi:hypothetical protein
VTLPEPDFDERGRALHRVPAYGVGKEEKKSVSSSHFVG